MSNKFKIVLLLVLSGLLITGCNDKKKRSAPTPQGNVVFYHNIDGMGELLLKAVNTSERNSYGTVDYQQFTNSVFLTRGNWSVNVVDGQGTLSAIDDESLTEGDFTVTADAASVVAITASQSAGQYKIHTLPFAKNSAARNINVSHVNQGLTPVDIYIVPAGEVANPEAPNLSTLATYKLSNLTFGKTSDDLIVPLPNDKDEGVFVYMTTANTTTPVYESGLRELKNNNNQTLLINSNTSSNVPSISYYSNGRAEVWNSIEDRKGQVRIINAYDSDIKVSTEDAYGTVINFGDVGAPAAYALTVSDYQEDLASGFRYSIQAEVLPNLPSLPSLPLYLNDGEQWSVIFFGNNNDQRLLAHKVKEKKNAISGQSAITVSNAAYFPKEESPILFDVYIYKKGQNPENIQPAFSEMVPASYGSKNVVANNDGSTSYQVDVIGSVDGMIYHSGEFTPTGGENYPLIISGDLSTGFSICAIDVVVNENICSPL